MRHVWQQYEKWILVFIPEEKVPKERPNSSKFAIGMQE